MPAPTVTTPQASAAARALWPHQREAVDAITKTLRERARATAIAACGSGKTRIGGEVAAALVPPGGRLLIVAPTLELISQTLHEYRETFGEAAVGRLIAVCSDQAAIHQSQVDLAAEHAEVTTDPALLAELLAQPGRVSVACTYTSLVVLRDAHRRFGVPAWDLAVIDEAHRSAGMVGKPWGLIHDDALIPARRRLYMSATPRLLTGTRDEYAVGMEDETVFGPVCFRLSFADAIERGLLADYRVVVPVIADEQIHRLVADERPGPFLAAGGRAAVSPQVLATQIAVLRAAREHGARRIISYHNTIKAADGFAATLHAAAALLPDSERPSPLTALSVCGRQPVDKRRAVLRRLGGDEPGVIVVSNARVLAEGVNIPAVDAVAFLDPRDSPESIAQAVGRALRTGGRRDKVATIIIPVLVAAGQSPESALDSSIWEPVWRTVRALRAHDERLAARLDALRQRLGAARDSEQEGIGSLPDWMHLSGMPVPASFAAAVALKVVTTASSSWEEHYGRLLALHQRHGYLKIDAADTAMGRWVEHQRRLHHLGALAPQRVARLNAFGFAWRPRQEAWQRGLDSATDYHRQHGNLNIASTQSWKGFPLGPWLADQRRKHAAGQLPAARIQALEVLGIEWDQTNQRDEDWQANLALAADYRAVRGHLDVKDDEMWQGQRLGRWLSYQRRRYAVTPRPGAQIDTTKAGQRAEPTTRNETSESTGGLPPLTPGQITALESLGIDWDPLLTAWNEHLKTVIDYVLHHGTLPRKQTIWGEPPFGIGDWYRRESAKARAGKLTDTQAAAINALAAAPGRQALTGKPGTKARAAVRQAEPQALGLRDAANAGLPSDAVLPVPSVPCDSRRSPGRAGE